MCRNFEENDLCYEEWKSVLHLSTCWSFSSICKLALSSTEPPTLHDQLLLACAYSVDDWVVPALSALCERTTPLTLSEACQMNIEDVVVVSTVREHIRDHTIQVNATEIPLCVEAEQLIALSHRVLPPSSRKSEDDTSMAGAWHSRTHWEKSEAEASVKAQEATTLHLHNKAKERTKAEEKVRQEAEEKTRKDVEEKPEARLEAENVRKEAEEMACLEAEMVCKAEEAMTHLEAERAHKDAEEMALLEADKAHKDAEKKAHKDRAIARKAKKAAKKCEAEAMAEAEAKAKAAKIEAEEMKRKVGAKAMREKRKAEAKAEGGRVKAKEDVENKAKAEEEAKAKEAADREAEVKAVEDVKAIADAGAEAKAAREAKMIADAEGKATAEKAEQEAATRAATAKVESTAEEMKKERERKRAEWLKELQLQPRGCWTRIPG